MTTTTSERARLASVRRRAGEALFLRVAGADGGANRARIHGAPGPRWFPAGSPVQVVHGDASMFVGGLRALLLQALHPAAMAGVAAHSDFRDDPWGRLARTSTFLAVTAFGTVDDAEAAVARVRRVHAHVRGVTADGIAYAADDPHLLAWVHAAEVDSFVAAHRAHGQDPLDDAGYDEYLAQMATVARRLGVVDPPETLDRLAAQLDAYRPELVATDAALETVEFLLRRPPVPVVVRPPYAGLVHAAAASLPAWARTGLGLPARPLAGGAPARVAGDAVTRVIRWLLPPPGRPVTGRSVRR